jgi:hypothetical protein
MSVAPARITRSGKVRTAPEMVLQDIKIVNLHAYKLSVSICTREFGLALFHAVGFLCIHHLHSYSSIHLSSYIDMTSILGTTVFGSISS